jgi:nucleoside-diphosphate-sugar epimerase
MRLAMLGATSEIAKDLVLSFSALQEVELALFARRPNEVAAWLKSVGLKEISEVLQIENFGVVDKRYDAVLNFVGSGNPARIAQLGSKITDITRYYDQKALDHVSLNPDCRYIFFSSGAVFGDVFTQPVTDDSAASVSVNSIHSGDWYGLAKLEAEIRHRRLQKLPIVDLRVFNYFSHTQNLTSSFMIAEVMRALLGKTMFATSTDDIVRDYLHPEDLFQLVQRVLQAPPANAALDCYSGAPVTKMKMLDALRSEFGLKYFLQKTDYYTDGNSAKSHYYSLSRRAEKFGYNPQLTSLQGVVLEAKQLLRKQNLSS